jgi:hypothetical protein
LITAIPWRRIATFQNVVIAMVTIFYIDAGADRILIGLTLAETRELEALERRTPSLAEWDAFSMQPVSSHEKRWAYLSQKHIDAMRHRAAQPATLVRAKVKQLGR